MAADAAQRTTGILISIRWVAAAAQKQLRIAGRGMAKGASWSMKELQQAIRMKRRGVGYAEIAIALGRPMDAVEAKLEFCSNKPASREPDAPTPDVRGRSRASVPPAPDL